jgi:hypothetical protein
MTIQRVEEAALEHRAGATGKERAAIAAAIVALTALGFLLFPGRTFLQSDTQIYLPILARISDPSLYARDLVAQHPHVSFTIYDEVTLALRRITGLGFQEVLVAQQLLFRALGILGVFLIAAALKLSTRAALLVAAIFSLGATVPGPTVLLFEYEPVPRGFAIPLLFLAIGLAAHGRDVAAGVAASLAFLYHPPSVYPFWIVYFCLTLLPSKPAVMSRRILGLAPILAGVIALLLLSRLTQASGELQSFFSRLDPEMERLQRMRAPYVWVSIWGTAWFWHFAFLWGVSLAAFWRVRKSAGQDLRFFLIGLPAIGMASFPVSYLLLEHLKWSLMPQVQPLRAVLYITAIALILAAVAAGKAAERGRYWESFLWLLPAFAIPMHTRVLEVLWPNLSNPLILRRALLLLVLAALATAGFWAARKRAAPGYAAWAAAAVLPFLLIPTYGQVKNYPVVDNPDLDALCTWARSSTVKDAVFQFPDAGNDLQPGIFRANAQRAVYADWKAGGQINFLKVFATEWWPRWQAAGGKTPLKSLDAYGAMGIDYIVLRQANRLRGKTPVFENARFVVYATGGQSARVQYSP